MTSQTRIGILAIIVVIPLLSFGVWNSNSSSFVESAEGKSGIVAIASFYPLYEFTKYVGGERVDVSLLVPQGVEPHDWEPSIRDVQRIQNADLIIINGIGFENWLDNIDTINSDVKIIDSSFGIDIISSYEDEDEHGELHEFSGDPHIWLNPVSAKSQVQNIADGLKQKDPQNSKYYQENADNYKLQLDSLDEEIRNELSTCKRDFISFHNAFSYFANEYELNQHSIIESIEPHGEPTSKKLQNVINLAKSLNTRVIFTEEAVDARTSQVIANEFGGSTLVLSTLEVIDDDSSYIKKMKENLENLKVALCN